MGKVDDASNPNYLKGVKKEDLQTVLFDAYDLDNDNVILWAEYKLSNKFLKHKNPHSRKVFQYFDRNLDWRITEK